MFINGVCVEEDVGMGLECADQALERVPVPPLCTRQNVYQRKCNILLGKYFFLFFYKYIFFSHKKKAADKSLHKMFTRTYKKTSHTS